MIGTTRRVVGIGRCNRRNAAMMFADSRRGGVLMVMGVILRQLGSGRRARAMIGLRRAGKPPEEDRRAGKRGNGKRDFAKPAKH